MNDCIFCKIIAGEIPSYKVYEDEQCFAFLDIQPVRPGHTLVIPKKHESEFQNLDSESYTAVMAVVKKIAERIAGRLVPKRVGLMIAGWDVPHAHVHVVPMEEVHDLVSKRALTGEPLRISPEEFAALQKKLSQE